MPRQSHSASGEPARRTPGDARPFRSKAERVLASLPAAMAKPVATVGIRPFAATFRPFATVRSCRAERRIIYCPHERRPNTRTTHQVAAALLDFADRRLG